MRYVDNSEQRKDKHPAPCFNRLFEIAFFPYAYFNPTNEVTVQNECTF